MISTSDSLRLVLAGLLAVPISVVVRFAWLLLAHWLESSS